MTQGLLIGSGTSMRVGHVCTSSSMSAPVESQKGSVLGTLISHFVRVALSKPAASRKAIRRLIVELLGRARDPDRCIDALLQVCTTEGGPDGLDMAIDVLGKTGPLILEYAWDYLQRDIRNWNPASERAYQPNDDYWYVLLRAVGRGAAPESVRFRFITCCADAASRGIREGVVEALRDLGTEAAKERISRFAEQDPDEFIRKIAGEALDDLES